MPYDNKLPRVLISENCISHLKMRVFWLSGPNGWPDKKLKHKGNVAHSTFRGGCVIDLVWKNYSLYVKIAIFSYKLDTLYISFLSTYHIWTIQFFICRPFSLRNVRISLCPDIFGHCWRFLLRIIYQFYVVTL